MLPDLSPGPGRDTLLYLETGQQSQPLHPTPCTCPAGPAGIPSRVAERLKWRGTRQTRKILLRVTLIIQNNSPDLNDLKDPREDHSSPSTCGSPDQRAAAPQPMRIAPWAQHLRRVPYPNQRR